jgi:oligo-1,6-glucosidase
MDSCRSQSCRRQHVAVNAASDRAADRSVFAFYRGPIALRHSNAVVALGRFTMLEEDRPRLYAFTRDGDAEQLSVVGNVSGETLDAPVLAGWLGDVLIITNYPSEAAQTTTLAPWEVRVYRRLSRPA